MRRADAYAYRPAEDRQGEKGGHDTQVSMHKAPSPAKAVRSMGARGDMPALPERIACALATTGPDASSEVTGTRSELLGGNQGNSDQFNISGW